MGSEVGDRRCRTCDAPLGDEPLCRRCVDEIRAALERLPRLAALVRLSRAEEPERPAA